MEEGKGRSLTPEEVSDIVVGASETISKRLDEGAVIVPKLIRAALDFYMWLSNAGRIEEDYFSQSRSNLRDDASRNEKTRPITRGARLKEQSCPIL